MKNLYEAATVVELKQRIARLEPGSQRQWGKMNVAQAVAHCSRPMEWAVGDSFAPRMFIGRILGPMVKSKVLKDENPTAWELKATGYYDIPVEKLGVAGIVIEPTKDVLRLQQKVIDAVATEVPWPKRCGEPVEFAKLAAHIVDNSFLNAAVIRLDGGHRMNFPLKGF